MLGRASSSATPASGCTSRYSSSPAHPAFTPWWTRVTGVSGLHQIEQLRDVLGIHAQASMADPHADAERLVGPVDQILRKPEIQCVGPERIVRVRGRPPGGSGSPFLAASSRIDSGGYHVGRAFFLTMLVSPSGVSQPTLPMLIGPRAHHLPALREVVDTHLGDVDHEPRTRRLGEDGSGGQPDGGPLAREPDVHSRVGELQLRKPHSETPRDVEQRVLVPRDVDLVAAHHRVGRSPCATPPV